MSRSGPRGGRSPPPPTPTGPTAATCTRYTAAANAYAQLRTAWGRSEAYADLTADLPGTVARRTRTPSHGANSVRACWGWPRCIPARIWHGRPRHLLFRALLTALLSLAVVNLLPGQPSGPAVVTGLITWFLLTARGDLAPPPGR